MKFVSLVVCALIALTISPAQAKHRHRHHSHTVTSVAHPDCNRLWPCEGVRPNPRGVQIYKVFPFGMPQQQYTRRSEARRARPQRVVSSYGAPSFNPAYTVRRVAEAVTQFLPHPAGCPRIAFCGCGAAQEVGKSGDRSLWLASNWYKFPRTYAASGMAAVRPHHVFVLKQHIQGDLWMVADHNSGGHMSRLHVRSIAGYTIVNPHG